MDRHNLRQSFWMKQSVECDFFPRFGGWTLGEGNTQVVRFVDIVWMSQESFPPWVFAGWLQYFGSLLMLVVCKRDVVWYCGGRIQLGFLLTNSKHKETHSWPGKEGAKNAIEERFGVFMYIYIPDSLGAFKNCKVSSSNHQTSANEIIQVMWKLRLLFLSLSSVLGVSTGKTGKRPWENVEKQKWWPEQQQAEHLNQLPTKYLANRQFETEWNLHVFSFEFGLFCCVW